MTIEFGDTVEELILCAAYVAQLVREGVTFRMKRGSFGVSVELTGSY